MSLKERIQKLYDAGHRSYADIARMAGCDKSTVSLHLGTKCDAEQWEIDRQRHAEFFNGLTPAQEYAQHANRRAELNSQFDDEQF